jgi:hypothetical protein
VELPWADGSKKMMAMAAAEEQISKDRTRNKVYMAGDWVGEKKSFFYITKMRE